MNLEEDGNFLTGLGLGWAFLEAEWGTRLPRFYTNLEMPMQWSRPDEFGSPTNYVQFLLK